jgi:hypothetical protein
MAPPEWLVERLAAMRERPESWRHAAGGYTPAERWVVRFADGATAFVKAGTPINEEVAGWLRTEHRLYKSFRAPFLAEVLAWSEEGDLPVLLLEDLSGGEWPPPWTPGKVDRVLVTLERVAATEPPSWVPPLEALGRELAGWHRVAESPAEFLSLGLASAEWLDGALPSLVDAEAAAKLAGDSLMHVDVRSDNICFADDRTILVDWNSVCVGNPVVDVAFWLPSLQLEGGPSPSEILQGEPEIAAFVAGFFACRAGLPPIPTAPRVRHIQLAQLQVALPWAAEALGLPPPAPSSIPG